MLIVIVNSLIDMLTSRTQPYHLANQEVLPMRFLVSIYGCASN